VQNLLSEKTQTLLIGQILINHKVFGRSGQPDH